MIKIRRLAIGDIHGRIGALIEVFKKSNFNKNKDLLIVLGDIADGGYNTNQVIEELMTVKNLVLIMGNHDEWFLNHIRTGWAQEIWLSQGGRNTLKSYSFAPIPLTHQEFLNKASYWYKLDGMIFVHGGFNPKIPKMRSQSKKDLLWDRDLINFAKRKIVPGYDKVFVGHTTTELVANSTEPQKFNNLIMLDTGAGWTGKLTIMDIDTEKYWQSKKQEPAR